MNTLIVCIFVRQRLGCVVRGTSAGKHNYPPLGRMGTSFGRSDFWDRSGGQALVMIGRWFSRQPLTNRK